MYDSGRGELLLRHIVNTVRANALVDLLRGRPKHELADIDGTDGVGQNIHRYIFFKIPANTNRQRPSQQRFIQKAAQDQSTDLRILTRLK